MRLGTAQSGEKTGMGHGILAVLAAAAILRAGWALAVPVEPVSDGHVYDLLARNLAQGMGYFWAPGIPTAHWPVGTSFVYSLLYRCFGVSYTPIVVLNIAISLATIWLTMVVAERWFDGKTAMAAGAICAVWPLQIEFTTVLASELLFNFLMMAMLAVWEWRKLNPWVKAIAIGLLTSATSYIRPVAILLPVILYALTMLRERRIARPMATAAVAFAAMALAIAPWSIRNTRIFGHFVLLSANGGENLWEGNNPGTTGETEPMPAEALSMQEAERDNYLGTVAKAYIRAYPGRFAARTLKKAVLLHSHETIGVHWNLATLEKVYGERAVWLLKLGSDGFWWMALLLGVAGAWLLARQRGIWAALTSPPIVLWGYFTVLYSIMVVQDRYHFPSLPFIGMLAGFALVTMRGKMVERKTASAG